MKVNKKYLQSNGKDISYTHFETGSNKVCFMFSGAGYRYDKPLFYYATMTMLEHQIDVVQIHYAYEEDLFDSSLEEISKIMMDDINPVLMDVLKNEDYKEIIFLGKSLGTIPIATDLLKRDEFLKSKMIFLTPLLKFDLIFDYVLHSKHQGLLVIGDKDPHYNSEQIEKLRNTNVKIEVVKNANHSLDIEELDTSNSLLALTRVMQKLQEALIALP